MVARDFYMSTYDEKQKRTSFVFTAVFFLLVVGIAVNGYVSYRNFEQEFRLQAERQISAIAELKVNDLVNWREERLGDAETFYHNPTFSALVGRYFENSDDVEARAGLLAWLGNYQVYDQYDRVRLLDVTGAERLSIPTTPETVETHLVTDATASLRSGKVTFLDFQRDAGTGGDIHISILVPIFADQNNKRPLGVLVLRIDPETYLYPYIQQWPVPSQSAETLLIRREGDEALFLNNLRFQTDTALTLRISLEEIEVPAVKAALEQTGIVEGLDYRGEPVLADVRAVPDSPWFLVAKMDTVEVYAPLRTRLRQTFIIIGMAIFAAGAGLALVWRQGRIRFYREQVDAAQALRESEEKYRRLFDNASLGIFQSTPEGKAISANDAFARMFGYDSPEDTIRSIKNVSTDIFADPNRRAEIIRLMAENPDLRTFVNVYRRKDGSTFIGSLNTMPIRDSDGSLIRIEGIIEDITERVRAEDLLHQQNNYLLSLQETALELISQLDSETLLENIVRRAGQLMGTPSGFLDLIEPATGRLLPRIGIGALADSMQYPVQPGEGVAGIVWQTGKPFIAQDYDQWMYRAASYPLGKLRSVIGVPLLSGGKVMGALGLAYGPDTTKTFGDEDVGVLEQFARMAAIAIVNAGLFATAQRELAAREQAEEEIRKLNAELEQRVRERTAQLEISNKELEAFAYSISHDLRAPLRGIDGWSQALLEDYRDKLDEQGQQYLDRVRSEAQHMGHLIESMLQLSRLTRTEMITEPVNLSALAQTIAERLQATEPLRKVDFTIQAGLTAEGDPRLLEVVLTNLLGNALKFSGKRADAHIEFGGTESPGQRVFFVRDNGAGFDMDFARKLFGAFQRMHKTSEFPGTGIGLATVQRIVHRHGGRVWAEAEVGRGATFYFTLG
jgi:PAS domain S-box-containing protein